MLYPENGGEPSKARRAIIKPNGFTIPEEVSRIHGISHEMAVEQGEDLEDVLSEFLLDLKKCSMLIAHNMQFDRDVIRTELVRALFPLEERTWFRKFPKVCTMLTIAEKGQRWPRLGAAYAKHCNKTLEGAHQATNDTLACGELFFKIRNTHTPVFV